MYGVGFFMGKENLSFLKSLPGYISELISKEFTPLHSDTMYNSDMILKSYNYGRIEGNIVRAMDRNKYRPNDEQIGDLFEDLNLFEKYYFDDATINQNAEVNKINGIDGERLSVNEFFQNRIKRQDTERLLYFTYADRWIMYNKLFGGSK